MGMHYGSMLHHEPDLEQTSLLQPSVQPFVVLMPTDSDASLSIGSAGGNPRSDPGSGLGTDVDVLFMQGSNRLVSSTACTEPQFETNTSRTAPQIYHINTSTIQHP